MLRLFRHIRQRLLLRRPEGYEGHVLEGRVSRYFGYAIGEIVLIVAGILIALQINNWNEERKDRLEEKQILGRISEELNLMISDTEWMLKLPARRKEALDRLSGYFEGQPIEDELSFLEDVANSGSWDQPNLIRSTYHELHASGKLALIQNVELRNKITRFYGGIEGWEKRATLRVTGLAKLAYELVPTAIGGENAPGRTVREGLSDQQHADLVKMVLGSDLKRLITPARNREDFLEVMWSTIQEDSSNLIAAIEADLATH